MTSIQSNTEYDYNTTTIQMGFRRKSNEKLDNFVSEGAMYLDLAVNIMRIFKFGYAQITF